DRNRPRRTPATGRSGAAGGTARGRAGSARPVRSADRRPQGAPPAGPPGATVRSPSRRYRHAAQNDTRRAWFQVVPGRLGLFAECWKVLPWFFSSVGRTAGVSRLTPAVRQVTRP